MSQARFPGASSLGLVLVVSAAATLVLGSGCATGPTPGPAAPTPVTFDANAHIIRVVDERTVVIGRGSRDGLVAAKGLAVSPRPAPTEADPTPAVRFEIHSALADVATIGPDETTLTLRAVTEPVSVGDFVLWSGTLPRELRDDPVARLAIADIGLRTLDDIALVVMPDLQQRGVAAADAAVAAMVDEIHARAELARGVHDVPFDGGRFVGLTLTEAFAQTSRADVLAFLDFVVSFPGKYVSWDWKLVEVYATWLINHAPSGTGLTQEREAQGLRRDAQAAVLRRDWTAATTAWRRVLALVPDDKDAADGIARIERLSRADTALQLDPDDHQAQWERGKAYAELGLPADALADFEALVAAGYRVRDARSQRAYRLAALGRLGDAAAELEALLAEKEDAGLRGWLDFVRARGRRDAAHAAGRTREEADVELEIGAIHERDGSWSSALGAYQRMLALEGATASQRERASEGQHRVAQRSNLVNAAEFARANIADHDLGSAASRLERVVRGYDELGLREEADTALGAFAAAAEAAGERQLERDLLGRLAERRPTDPDPWTRLGWSRMNDRDLAGGLTAFERALSIAPDDAWARGSRSWALIALERWDDAAAAARSGAEDAAPLAIAMTRISAARGDGAELTKWAERAATLDPDRWGAAARAAEQLAALPRDGKPRTALSRIRALVTLALPQVALRELRKLDGAPAELRRDAAWAIAADRNTLVDRAIGLEAAEVEGGTTPARKRVLAYWRALDAVARDPTSAARRALAEAYVALADFDAALATIGGGTADTTRDGGAPVDPSLLDVRARALSGLEGARRMELGKAAAARGDGPGALAAYAEAAERFPLTPSSRLAADFERVRLLIGLGRAAEARALSEAALAEARADGSPLTTLDFQAHLARLDLVSGDVKPLGAAYAEHLATCRALELEHCEAVLRIARSDLESSRGEADLAVTDAEAARALWRGLRDAAGVRTATLKLAALRRYRGELREAAELAEAAWRDAVAKPDRNDERAALIELGRIAIQLGDAEAAHRWLRAASAAADRDDDSAARAIAAYWSGRVALDLDGNPKVAEAELERALRTFEARGEELEAIETTVLLARAAPARALTLTQGLVERARRHELDVFVAQALEARATALLAARRASEAQPLAAEAVTLGDRIGIPEVQARVRHLAARLARESGDERAATDHFAAAARAVGATLTRTGGALPLGAEATRRVIDDAIAALYAAGRTAEALEIVELQHLARAGRLFDPQRIRTNDADLDRSLAELGRARAEGELARARLREGAGRPAAVADPGARNALVEVAARSDQEVAALLMKLQRDHRGVYGALAVSPLTLVQQRTALPKDAVVVDYFAAGDALYAFVVRRDDPAPKAIRVEVPRDRLTQTIARHRQLLARDGRLAEPAARDLYGWLLAPLEDLVPAARHEATTLVVIAEGPLQYVPFAALVASPAGKPVTYAVERWRIATALSTTLFELFEPAPPRLAQPGVLAFLDPTGELPGARDELAGVARVTALRGAEASLEAFLAEAPRHAILHFATHGAASAEDPLASGLRLATGVLSVDAITGLTALRGHVRLVVLSACQTAIEVADAALAPPDEVISAARGFAVAGVPSVIGSLWDVDDDATRALMQAFYAALATPHLDTLGALRAAQLKLLGRGSDAGQSETEQPLGDPRLWAGFQLVGDWR